jgi:hypothetical protein
MAEMLGQLGAGTLTMNDLPEKAAGAEGLAQPVPLFPRIKVDSADLLKG